MKKRNLGALLVFSALTIVGLTSCNNNKKAIYDWRNGSVKKLGEIEVKFYDIPNLPYVNVSTYLKLFTGCYSVSNDNGVFTFTNTLWNGKSYTDAATSESKQYNATATYNSNTKDFVYGDYACFTNIDEDAATPVDIVAGKNIKVNNKNLFKLDDSSKKYRAGNKTTINLGTYHIDTRVENGNLYMPFYTAKSLFVESMVPSYFYNGNGFYCDARDNDTYALEIKKTTKFSPTTAYLEYSFYQFCLDLDLNYGMKGANRTLRKTKENKTYLSAGALSTLESKKSNFISSASGFDNASIDFYKNNLDDGGHTSILGKSYLNNSSTRGLAESDWGEESKYLAESKSQIVINRTEKEFASKIIKNVSENKVVLRLDTFEDGRDNTDDGLSRIVELSTYMTTNEGKKKTQLIIDLSCNGGGYVYLQYLLTSYLTRGAAPCYVCNSINNSYGSVKYNIDINLDGLFDDKDALPNTITNLDIITSNYTFSAANATAMYVNSYKPDVTSFAIQGEKSGGGMCSVDTTMMTPTGMSAQWSSPNRMCLENKDDCIQIEQGTTPNPSWSSHTTNEDAKKFSDYAKID